MKLSLSFQELNPVYSEDYDTEEGSLGVGYWWVILENFQI
jgi:hypothetical protein